MDPLDCQSDQPCTSLISNAFVPCLHTSPIAHILIALGSFRLSDLSASGISHHHNMVFQSSPRHRLFVCHWRPRIDESPNSAYRISTRQTHFPMHVAMLPRETCQSGHITHNLAALVGKQHNSACCCEAAHGRPWKVKSNREVRYRSPQVCCRARGSYPTPQRRPQRISQLPVGVVLHTRRYVGA